jgi:hypothetical protein
LDEQQQLGQLRRALDAQDVLLRLLAGAAAAGDRHHRQGHRHHQQHHQRDEPGARGALHENR